MPSLKSAQICLAVMALIVAVMSFVDSDDHFYQREKLTRSIIAWTSAQCESIVEEMEAISKQNAESRSLNVANYLRYLHSMEELRIIANEKIPELKWVSLKARIFERIYQDTIDVLSSHIEDLDTKLRLIEKNEPKSKQTEVTAEWLDIYQRIRYVATHAMVGSKLQRRANELLQTSPTNSKDKMRSMRYELKTRAFSR